MTPRRLLIQLESARRRDELRRFLRDRSCRIEDEGETGLAVEDCDQAPPGLATLVALVEEWRGRAGGEAVLVLGERRSVLRTEV